MFREATIAAVALAGHVVTAYSLQKRDGAGGHSHGSSEHAAAPAPAGGYSAPAQGYAEPAPSYGAPSSSYGVSSGYGGYDEPGFPDITPIILGLLILGGLSLLFPTYVSLTSVRRKRDLDGVEDVDPMTDMVERVNDIYMAVVESEECMERIACEVGGLAGDFGLKENTLTKVAEPFVPLKYKGYYKQFTAGKDCQKIKCGSFSF